MNFYSSFYSYPANHQMNAQVLTQQQAAQYPYAAAAAAYQQMGYWYAPAVRPISTKIVFVDSFNSKF